jgi:predicted porin
MRKLLTTALALAFAAIAVPAFASVQNVKVYGNLDNTFLQRNNLDFKDSRQSSFFTQTRIGIDADLTDNVGVTFGLINERPWTDTQTSSNTDIDLYLAYATIREMLYSPLTVIIGRQQWGYGNGLIFNASGRNNSAPVDSGLRNIANDFTYQKSLDAIRLILDYNPLAIEAFYAVLRQGTAPGFTKTPQRTLSDNISLFGVNLSYALGDDMDSVLEAYFFNKKDGSNVDGAAPDNSQGNLYVSGLRGSTNPVEGLNLQLEFAKQHGKNHDDYARSRQGYAIQAIVNYQLPVMEELNPVFNYTLTKVSGDSDSAGRDKAWDPFYETQGGNTIYNSIFSLTNLHIHSVSLETTPVEDLTAKLSYHGLWLDARNGGLTVVSPYADSLSYSTNSNKNRVGSEVDLDLTYAYTEDVTIGASLGYFLPGNLFADVNDTTAKQAIVSVGVAF